MANLLREFLRDPMSHFARGWEIGDRIRNAQFRRRQMDIEEENSKTNRLRAETGVAQHAFKEAQAPIRNAQKSQELDIRGRGADNDANRLSFDQTKYAQEPERQKAKAYLDSWERINSALGGHGYIPMDSYQGAMTPELQQKLVAGAQARARQSRIGEEYAKDQNAANIRVAESGTKNDHLYELKAEHEKFKRALGVGQETLTPNAEAQIWLRMLETGKYSPKAKEQIQRILQDLKARGQPQPQPQVQGAAQPVAPSADPGLLPPQTVEFFRTGDREAVKQWIMQNKQLVDTMKSNPAYAPYIQILNSR